MTDLNALSNKVGDTCMFLTSFNLGGSTIKEVFFGKIIEIEANLVSVEQIYEIPSAALGKRDAVRQRRMLAIGEFKIIDDKSLNFL